MLDLPFSTRQFFEVFRIYNETIWPYQIIAYVLGGLAVILSFSRASYKDKIISTVLGVFWLWMGSIYHISFFSEINQAAYVFGALFVLQGIFFITYGVISDKLEFSHRNDIYGIVGALLIVYAMLIYPILGSQLGHGYPYAPMFGVAPCPATIFTFGLLLWTKGNVSWWLLVIPGIWSLIGFSAALNLGVLEDIGLLIAGIITIVMLGIRNKEDISKVKLDAYEK